jgi:uncharacterized protein
MKSKRPRASKTAEDTRPSLRSRAKAKPLRKRSLAKPKQARKTVQGKRISTVPSNKAGPAAEFAAALKFPEILLEGDEPSQPPQHGPGRKFELGSTASLEQAGQEQDELPEAYGTGRLFLVPRDPHCLYAHWDLTSEIQQRYNASSLHQHLIIRLYLDTPFGEPVAELHVHPESRHWFVHVERAGCVYVAELGHYLAEQDWHRIALSEPIATPSDAFHEEGPVQFATMIEPSIPTHSIQASEQQTLPAAAYQQIAVSQDDWIPEQRASTEEHPVTVRPWPEPGLDLQPAPPSWKFGIGDRLALAPPALPLTLEQERVLEKNLGVPLRKTHYLSSMEIEELIRPRLETAAAGELGQAAPIREVTAISSPMPAELGVTSPAGGELRRPLGFWFNVNAELVIYGATEPDAQVTIGGRPIQLRPDGTFSYRFALPDGSYCLPISAIATRGDTRQAKLSFSRSTAYLGEVGAHPQHFALKRPDPQNVS